MSNYYNYAGILTELNKRKEEATAKKEWWEKVTFPVKKDGSAFKVLSKNIDGARLSCENYTMQAGENTLQVGGWTNGRGYVTDEIKCYELVRYIKDEKKLAKKENYQPKQAYLEQVYTFDLEDIKEAVAARIEYLKKYIEDLEKQIAKSLEVFNAYKEAYTAAQKTLENATKDFSGSDLFYAVRDTVKERYPYC